ncbi:MAG: hypothetical protein RMH81_01280 [Thermomicrobium sp.]|nr:hypothetical protein [Thermomicrobium sp.]
MNERAHAALRRASGCVSPREQEGWHTAAVAWLVAVLVACLFPLAARANGGQVRIANYPIGPYEVTIFTSPVPLQTGTIDVSVLLQRRDDKSIVDDAEITLTVQPAEAGALQRYPVTREQATNKLYYAAEFPLDQPGTYRMQVEIRAPEGSGAVAFDVTVERARSSLWRSWWLWAAIALVSIPALWWLFGGSPRGSRRAQLDRTAPTRRR